MLAILAATIFSIFTGLALNDIGFTYGLNEVVLTEEVLNSTSSILYDKLTFEADFSNAFLNSIDYNVAERITVISAEYAEKDMNGTVTFEDKLEYENQMLHIIHELDIFGFLADNLDLENYTLTQLFEVYMSTLKLYVSNVGEYEASNLFFHFLSTDYITRLLLRESAIMSNYTMFTHLMLNLNLWGADLGDELVGMRSEELIKHIFDLQPYYRLEDIERINTLKNYVAQGEDIMAFVKYRSDVIYKAFEDGFYLNPSDYNTRVMFEMFKTLTESKLTVDEMNNFIFEEAKSVFKSNYESGVKIDENFLLLLYKEYITKWMQLNYQVLEEKRNFDESIEVLRFSTYWYDNLEMEDHMEPLDAQQFFLHEFQKPLFECTGYPNVPGERQRTLITLVEWMRVHLNSLQSVEWSTEQYTALLDRFYLYALEARLLLSDDIDSWMNIHRFLFDVLKQDLEKEYFSQSFLYLLNEARISHYVNYAKLMYVYSDLIENGWDEQNLEVEITKTIIDTYCQDSDYLYNLLTPEFIEMYLEVVTSTIAVGYPDDDALDLFEHAIEVFDANYAARANIIANHLSADPEGLNVERGAVFNAVINAINDLARLVHLNIVETWREDRATAMQEDIYGFRTLFFEEDSEWGLILDQNSIPLIDQGVTNYADKFNIEGLPGFLEERGDYLYTHYTDEDNNETGVVRTYIGCKWDALRWEMDDAMQAEIFFDAVRGAEYPINEGIKDSFLQQVKLTLERPTSDLNVGSKWLKPNPLSYGFTRDRYLYDSTIPYYGMKIGNGFIHDETLFQDIGFYAEDIYVRYAK